MTTYHEITTYSSRVLFISRPPLLPQQTTFACGVTEARCHPRLAGSVCLPAVLLLEPVACATTPLVHVGPYLCYPYGV